MTLGADAKPAEASIDQQVASALKRQRVPYVFGIPGGGSSIDLIEACRKEGIPFVLVQHETTAALMAVVCGELTDTCGAWVSIMGPGAANLAAGAGYAYWERHPLLCLTECYGGAQAPLMSIQKSDHALMFAAFCKQSVTLGASDTSQRVEDAIELAMAERPGPVHIDLPMGPGPRSNSTVKRLAQRPDSSAPSRVIGDLDAIADAVSRAERPILVAGPVVRRQKAESELLGLAEKLQLAVMVSSKARGVIPEDHPLFAGVISGVYGEETFEGRIMLQSDLVLAVGLDRMELLSPWSYPQPILALDGIEVPEEETVGQPVLRAAGPLPEMLRSLRDGLRARQAWDPSRLRAFWEETMHILGAGRSSLNAASLLCRARELAPRDAIVMTEAGVYGRVGLYAWKVYDPQTYFDSSGANTMGFSLPAALASSLLAPDKKTVALVGDAGFLMRSSELETAARLKLAPVVIVFNDGTLGMIRVKQRAKQYERAGVDLAPTDFVRLAESFGGRGWEVRTLDEFERAFAAALSSDRLAVIDARLDPEIYLSHIRPIRGY